MNIYNILPVMQHNPWAFLECLELEPKEFRENSEKPAVFCPEYNKVILNIHKNGLMWFI